MESHSNIIVSAHTKASTSPRLPVRNHLSAASVLAKNISLSKLPRHIITPNFHKKPTHTRDVSHKWVFSPGCQCGKTHPYYLRKQLDRCRHVIYDDDWLPSCMERRLVPYRATLEAPYENNFTSEQLEEMANFVPGQALPSWVLPPDQGVAAMLRWDDMLRTIPQWNAYLQKCAASHTNVNSAPITFGAPQDTTSSGTMQPRPNRDVAVAAIKTIKNVLSKPNPSEAELQSAALALSVRVNHLRTDPSFYEACYTASARVAGRRGTPSKSFRETCIEQFDKLFAKLPAALQTFLKGVIMSLDVLVAAYDNLYALVEALNNRIKPVALIAILNTYDGTEEGFAAVVTAILQLYGCLNVENLMGGVAIVWEIFKTLFSAGWNLLNRVLGRNNDEQSEQDAHLEGPRDNIFQILAVVAVGFFSFAFTKLDNNTTRTIRQTVMNVVCFTSLIKAVAYIVTLITERQQIRPVREWFAQLTKISDDIHNPNIASSISKLEPYKKKLEDLKSEIVRAATDPNYSKHNATLRTMVSTIEDLSSTISDALLGTQARPHPPVFYIFTGPPGIGKTVLCHHISKTLGCEMPSFFDLRTDHHDLYTGNDVCIWDEVDSDDDAAFIETTVALVNTQPMHLNCDLPGNKRKIFTSSLILGTSNTPTLLPPTHPRAGPFYRRVVIVDCDAPDLNRSGDYPTGYKPDMSHLTFSIRAVGSFTPRGDNLNDNIVKPKVTNFEGLIEHITNNLRRVGAFKDSQTSFSSKAPSAHLEAPAPAVPHNIVCVTNTPADWLTWFQQHWNANNSFINVSLNTPRGHAPGHNIIFRKDEHHKISDSITVKIRDWVPGVQDSDFNDVTKPVPRLPRDVNNHLSMHLFSSSVHLNMLPPSGMPIYHAYTARTTAEMLLVFRKEYGLDSIGLALKLFWGVHKWDPASLLERLITHTFPLAVHAFSITTPSGCFYIYTSRGMQVFFDPGVHYDNATQFFPAGLPSPSSSLGTNLVDAIIRIFKALVTFLPMTLTVSAMHYFITQRRGNVQSPADTRRVYSGIALHDDEYEEYREYRDTRDNRVTVADYIAAKSSLAQGVASASQRVALLANWLSARTKRGAGPASLESPPERTVTRELMRFDGSPGGYATHLGGGVYMANTHGLRPNMRFTDGEDYVIIESPLTTPDVTLIRASPISGCVRIGKGVPVTNWDGRKLIGSTNYSGTIDGQKIIGYTGLLIGGSVRGDCGKPYYNERGECVGIHSARFDNTKQVVISGINVVEKTPQTTWRAVPVKMSGLNLGPFPKGTAYGRSQAFPTIQSWEDFEPAAYGGPDPRQCPTQEKIVSTALSPYVGTKERDLQLLPLATAYVTQYLSGLLSFAPRPAQEGVMDAIKRLDLDTSCGPFVAGIKADWIKTSENGDRTFDWHSPFGQHITEMLACANSGIPIRNAYKIALKDEILPKPKCLQKRRLLWGTSVDLTVLANMVLGQLFDAIKSVHQFGPIAVGCNMDSSYPAMLVQRFMPYSILCLDYSKWDSTMADEVMQAAFDVLFSFVQPTHEAASLRETLRQRPVGYFMNLKVETTQGLPSGTPGTSIVNSVCHMIYYVMAIWLTEIKAGVAQSPDPLTTNPMVCYGDDCIYGHSGKIAANLEIFIDALRALGLAPTSPDKSSNIGYTHTMVFLKRTIQAKENLVVAPIDVTSLLRQAVYVKGSVKLSHLEVKKPNFDRTNQLQECVIALAAHPYETYCKYIHIFEQAVELEGCIGVNTDYKHNWHIYQSRYWAGDVNANQYHASQFFEQIEHKAHLEAPGDEQQQPPQQEVSTDGAAQPSGPLVTGSNTVTGLPLGAAGAPAGESMALATLGTTRQTQVWPEIYGLWVTHSRFAWTTAQPTGTRLFSLRLSPDINPYLSHLARMFAAWSGSVDVRILISGSGAYGGRITVAVIPPGIPFDSIHNPTAYDCAILDARNTEPAQITIPDIRLNTLHLMDQPDATSTLGIWVQSPLLNPYQAGVNNSAAEVTVMTSPGADFTFSLLREPGIAANDNFTAIMPASSLDLVGNRTGVPVIHLNPRESFVQSWNHYRSDGSTSGWGNAIWNPYLLLRVRTRVGTGAISIIGVTGTPYENTQDPVTGWPRNLPDYVCNSGWHPGTTWPLQNTGGVNPPASTMALTSGFVASINGSDPTPDVDENAGGFGALIIHGARATDAAATALIQAAPTTANRDLWVWADSDVFNSQTSYVLLSINGLYSSAQHAPTSYCIAEGDQPVIGTGGNRICTFGSRLPCSWPSSSASVIESSQPLTVSRGFATGDMPQIPPGQQAVFVFSNANGSFEVGLRPDGYFQMNGNAIVDLSQEYSITFQTLTGLNTVLSPPGGHGNASRFRRRR